MRNLYKIKKPENIWNPMHHRAQHKSRIKLEHDFHIDQVEPEISNQKKYNHDSNMKFWNVFNGQHTESQKIFGIRCTIGPKTNPESSSSMIFTWARWNPKSRIKKTKAMIPTWNFGMCSMASKQNHNERVLRSPRHTRTTTRPSISKTATLSTSKFQKIQTCEDEGGQPQHNYWERFGPMTA